MEVEDVSDTVLVGESNPYGQDPRYALYPLPERASGWNLCVRVLGMSYRSYLRRFDRVNLCGPRWTMVEARLNAGSILNRASELCAVPGPRYVVMLGARVSLAFQRECGPAWRGVSFAPFTAHTAGGPTLVCLPHPSGLSRAWNDPASFDAARRALWSAGVRWESEYPVCDVACGRSYPHAHCPECGSVHHVAADCDMEG